MQRLVTGALALSLLGSVAYAQPDDHYPPGGHPPPPHGAPHGGPAPGPRGGPPGVNRGPPPYPGRVWNAPRRFRGPAYYFPPGFGYRAWSFGMYLPGPFFMPNAMLGAYWTYGLQPPPVGFEWIRVGPDALLVRPGDGYILDVARGLFW